MKFLIALIYLVSMPLRAEPTRKELKPLVFPGGLVERIGEHKLMVTARGSALNRALKNTTDERPKQLTVEDRRLTGVYYVRGVPFVITEDRRGPRLEWAVVTTFREGLSPRQKGAVTLTTLAVELGGLATTHTWTGWAGVTAGVAAGVLTVRPILARQRGLRDLNLELRPATIDGKAALVQGIERDPEGNIKEVYLAGQTRLRDLVFSPNQADRLSRPPAPDDVVVKNPRLRLRGDTLIAKPRWWESSPRAELAADGRAFHYLFKFHGAWFVVRDDQALERVRVLRRGTDQKLYVTLTPVTLNSHPVTVEVVMSEGDRVQDVKMSAEVIRDDLVDPTTHTSKFSLSGFPSDQICAGQLDHGDYAL